MNLLLPLPVPHHSNLSFSQCSFLHNPMKTLPTPPARGSTIIRMGGGPRTFPGGVSKWVWKRMQAKKAKQLMKARLCRERQIYEMRKRAELKAAVTELERPWEVVEREAASAAPNLFSVGADEQVKVLADRFQRPGGFDLWSERDGPVLFESPDELPSARFFPKGVVHSVKPYRKVDGYGLVKGDGDGDGKIGLWKGSDLREMGDDWEEGIEGDGERGFLSEGVDEFEFEGDDGECLSFDENYVSDSGLRRNGNGRRFMSEDDAGSDGEQSSRLSYGRNGVDGGLRRNGNGNGRRFLSDDGVGSNGWHSSRLSYERNGVDGDGRLRRNGNVSGRRFSSSGDGGQSSRMNYGRNGVDGDGRMRKSGNGRRFLSGDDVGSDGGRSSRMGHGRNGVDGDDDDGLRRNGSGKRFSPSGDGGRSSRLNYGGDGVDGDSRNRRNGNGRRVLSDDDGRSSDGGRSSRFNYGRRNGLNVDGRMRRNESGSKYVSQGIDGANGGESSPRSSSSGRYGASFDGRSKSKGSGRRVLSKDVDRSGDGRLRIKENGRRFMSKDVDGSNGLYPGGVGSVMKQRGGYSIGGRSRGKYTNRTSDYGSARGRDTNSDVYDMGLQQDGSYGFLQKKREQPDSSGW